MRTKSIYSILTITSFLIISLILTLGASNLIVFFKTGGSPQEFLNVYEAPMSFIKSTWDTERAEGRRMETGTLDKITNDYQRGLKIVNQTGNLGNHPEFNDYLTSKARVTAAASILASQSDDYRNESQAIEQKLSLDFYSSDGSMVVFKDTRLSVDQLLDADGKIIASTYDTSMYHIMMLMEDNYWRIRHMKRAGASGIANEVLQEDANTFLTTNGMNFMLDSTRFIPRGINYYPADHPWELFWQEFDTTLLDKDFELIKELGLNTIRVFIPYAEFGGPDIEEEQLEKLEKLLDHAEENEFKVIVTLFDFFLDYDLNRWPEADRHIETLLRRFNTHAAIFAWDIKNEADLDFDSRGKEVVLNWLDFILKRGRTYDPNHMFTIGWSDVDMYDQLWDMVDFSSVHFYKKPGLLKEWIIREKIVQKQKPVFLGEFGRHTYKSWWYPIGYEEKDQNNYLEEILEVIDEYEMPYAIWTLHDFSNVPDHVAGSYPWRRLPQEQYGLIGKDQKPKEAYKTLKKYNNR